MFFCTDRSASRTCRPWHWEAVIGHGTDKSSGFDARNAARNNVLVASYNVAMSYMDKMVNPLGGGGSYFRRSAALLSSHGQNPPYQSHVPSSHG